jgi:hypothetical protein
MLVLAIAITIILAAGFCAGISWWKYLYTREQLNSFLKPAWNIVCFFCSVASGFIAFVVVVSRLGVHSFRSTELLLSALYLVVVSILYTCGFSFWRSFRARQGKSMKT